MNFENYIVNLKSILDNISTIQIKQLIDCLISAYEDQKMIFVIGNGGSAANASHFAQDLSKGVFLDQNINKRIKALSLTDNTAYITALGNDDGYDRIFEAQLRTFSEKGDILIAISGSGNSKNILAAIQFAKENGIKIIGITGYNGGELKKDSDISIHIPLNEMCTVESVHSIILHYVIITLREKLAKNIFDESLLTCLAN